MKKFSWIAIFAMAMVLTMGFVSCNNDPEPKEKPVKGFELKTGGEINDIFRNEEKLNAKLATAFAKATTAPAEASFYLDIAEKDVPVWYDEANTTIYYYIPEGKKLILNEDSSKMFAGLSYFESIDTSVFYTGNVTNMKSMFYSCETLKNLDLRSFDTSNVQNMRGMFEACNALETLDVSSFDTSNVTDMGFMFSALTRIKQLDLSNFNTSNVTNISFLFCHCWALESIDVSNFDTSNISDMGYLFLGCKLLKSIDLSTFDMSNVTNIKWMFQSCSELETIYVPNDLDRSSSTIITDSTEMFLSCPKLKGGTGTEYDAEKIDKTYARVDGGTTSPGYFTVKN